MTTLPADLPESEARRARLSVNALRALSFHAVEQANSGHPGMPMGCADLAYVLWTQFLRFDPTDPAWPDRDRFVLSAGHGSMLLYSLLHLTGFDLPIEELKNFRQWDSHTPGHPEYGHTAGVETTTGPLGQGFANAVGMALAEAMMGARFNRGDHQLVDHFTYAIAGDGCLMEGVSAEAASLAGHLGLGKLIVIYDDNGISIDGPTTLAFETEDVAKRFEAYGWHTVRINGHDHAQIADALRAGQAETARPTLILAKTTIGYGAPKKANTSGVHGSPLGADELAATRAALDWNYAPFEVPDEARTDYTDAAKRGGEAHAEWRARVEAAESVNGGIVPEFRKFLASEIPADLESLFPSYEAGSGLATRAASGKFLDAVADALPFLVGGSADLTPSNNTKFKGAEDVERGSMEGRYIRYGVREHAMVAINNGVALHGGFIPYGATFLVFTDYCRPSIRLAALMGARNIQVMTHDSIFLGEDGPTHQPVEHLEAMRAIPGVWVLRPGDPAEVNYAWELALRRTDGPSVLALTRQKLPVLARAKAGAVVGAGAGELAPASESRRGGYVIKEGKNGGAELDLIIIATGSELSLAIDAAHAIEEGDRSVRVVSMMCEEVFLAQDAEYRAQVLPTGAPRLAVEAGVTRGWWRWVGPDGGVVGLDRFGASAPDNVLAEKFGFTTENVVAQAQKLMR